MNKKSVEVRVEEILLVSMLHNASRGYEVDDYGLLESDCKKAVENFYSVLKELGMNASLDFDNEMEDEFQEYSLMFTEKREKELKEKYNFRKEILDY